MFNILIIIGIVFIFIFSNKYLYILSIKLKALLLLNKFRLKDLYLTFDSSVFLVSLPTNDYKLYISLPKDFKISYDFENFLFPRLKGIKVFYINDAQNKLIFYVSLADISLNKKPPHSQDVENLIIQELLFSKKMDTAIRQDVCKKLRERNY